MIIPFEVYVKVKGIEAIYILYLNSLFVLLIYFKYEAYSKPFPAISSNLSEIRIFMIFIFILSYY